MKIISWNCQGAFRKKAEFILDLKPDILVVPECEHPEKLKFKAGLKNYTDVVWFGSNPNKGIGVFSYSNYKFKLLELHNPDYKNILPIYVTGGPFDFILFAIWANNPKDPDGVYITQVGKAIHHYDNLIRNNHSIFIGDFNSNVIWDKKPGRKYNHSMIVELLERNKILSAYHFQNKQKQGKEQHHTFYLQRNILKPYHIDYCFISKIFIEKLKNVEVGTYENWITHSDHTPLSISFEL